MFMGFPIEIKKSSVLGFFCGRTRPFKIRTWNDTNKNKTRKIYRGTKRQVGGFLICLHR